MTKHIQIAVIYGLVFAPFFGAWLYHDDKPPVCEYKTYELQPGDAVLVTVK